MERPAGVQTDADVGRDRLVLVERPVGRRDCFESRHRCLQGREVAAGVLDDLAAGPLDEFSQAPVLPPVQLAPLLVPGEPEPEPEPELTLFAV
jgi:hypothetical protein